MNKLSKQDKQYIETELWEGSISIETEHALLHDERVTTATTTGYQVELTLVTGSGAKGKPRGYIYTLKNGMSVDDIQRILDEIIEEGKELMKAAKLMNKVGLLK